MSGSAFNLLFELEEALWLEPRESGKSECADCFTVIKTHAVTEEGCKMKRLDEKRRRLAAENLGLVRRALEECRLEDGGNDRGSVDRDDLYGAGCLGLCEAAACMPAVQYEGEPESGAAFEAFAMPVIKREIEAAMANGCGRIKWNR